MSDVEWVLVPREPTEAMAKASRLVYEAGPGVEIGRVTMWGANAWEAMLAAAPPPPTPPSDWNEAVKACARLAETEGVHPELNVFAGGPDWYKHGKRIATAIRTLTRPDPILATDAQSSGSADREDAEAAGSGPVSPALEADLRTLAQQIDERPPELRGPFGTIPASGQDGERVTAEAAPRLYLDCEFNGFGGELVSMALVADDGREWYAILPEPQVWNEWVHRHVRSVLRSEPPTIECRSREEFRVSLHAFLSQFDNPVIVADWYTDLVHFFQAFGGRDHSESIAYQCRCELRTDCPDIEAEVPHNALSDARAIRAALTAALAAKGR